MLHYVHSSCLLQPCADRSLRCIFRTRSHNYLDDKTLETTIGNGREEWPTRMATAASPWTMRRPMCASASTPPAGPSAARWVPRSRLRMPHDGVVELCIGHWRNVVATLRRPLTSMHRQSQPAGRLVDARVRGRGAQRDATLAAHGAHRGLGRRRAKPLVQRLVRVVVRDLQRLRDEPVEPGRVGGRGRGDGIDVDRAGLRERDRCAARSTRR